MSFASKSFVLRKEKTELASHVRTEKEAREFKKDMSYTFTQGGVKYRASYIASHSNQTYGDQRQGASPQKSNLNTNVDRKSSLNSTTHKPEHLNRRNLASRKHVHFECPPITSADAEVVTRITEFMYARTRPQTRPSAAARHQPVQVKAPPAAEITPMRAEFVEHVHKPQPASPSPRSDKSNTRTGWKPATGSFSIETLWDEDSPVLSKKTGELYRSCARRSVALPKRLKLIRNVSLIHI